MRKIKALFWGNVERPYEIERFKTFLQVTKTHEDVLRIYAEDNLEEQQVLAILEACEKLWGSGFSDELLEALSEANLELVDFYYESDEGENYLELELQKLFE